MAIPNNVPVKNANRITKRGILVFKIIKYCVKKQVTITSSGADSLVVRKFPFDIIQLVGFHVIFLE